nr:hypothetical protein [Tanacetum cinerariifolium]
LLPIDQVLTLGFESIYATYTCSPYEEIRILKKQNDDLKKKMDDREGRSGGSKSSEPTG